MYQSGCLLDNSAPRGPPDVPPRNPTMSRLNGRLPGSHAASDHERDPDLEPSCLVRTPSGNFYNIPKIPKNEYNNKNQSTGNSPIKVELQNNMDRVPLPYGHAPSMIPMRRQSIRCHFRKGIDWCSWKLIAIVVITLSLCLTAALAYVATSNIVTWSYQGTRACTVLIGDNTDAKSPTSESNKTSTSTASTSSQSASGRTRQQTSAGGNINPWASMLDRSVYSRKRRDVIFNRHATVLPHDTSSITKSQNFLREAEESMIQKSWSTPNTLHENNQGKVVVFMHDTTVHTKVANPSEKSDDAVSFPEDTREMSERMKESSTSPLGTMPLVGPVSDPSIIAANYSHYDTTTTSIELVSGSPVSETSSDPYHSIRYSSSSSEKSYSGESLETKEFTTEPSSSHTTNRRKYYTNTLMSSIESKKDFPGVPPIMDEIPYDEGVSMNIENRNMIDDSIVPAMLETSTVELTGNVDSSIGSNAILPDTVATPGNRSSKVNSFSTDMRNDLEEYVGIESSSSASLELSTTIDIEKENESRETSSIRANDFNWNETTSTTEKRNEITRIDRRTDELWNSSMRADKTSMKIENETANESQDREPPDSSSVVKETRELSREDSSAESVEDPAGPIKTSEKSEELQRDYPIPIYSYGQDEVEIVKLNHGTNSGTTTKTRTVYKPIDNPDKRPDILNNEVKTLNKNHRLDQRKDDLRVVMREGSDEEFLRKFEEQFYKEESSERDEPVIKKPVQSNFDRLEKKEDENGHEKSHDSSNDAFNGDTKLPIVQHVQIIEVPVERDHRSSSSSSSSSSTSTSTSSTHRVLVNVTIANGDSSSGASRPLYVLSVSVPMEIEPDDHSPNAHQIKTSSSSQRDGKITENVVNYVEPIDVVRLPPPPQPPASPPPPIWGGGECECSCPCMDSSSDEWDNFSAIDDTNIIFEQDFDQHEPPDNSSSFQVPSITNIQVKTDQLDRKPEWKENSTSHLEDLIKDDTTLTLEDYYTEEDNVSTTESSSTFEPETTTNDIISCSATTSLPPEPIILILEGARTFPARSFPPDGTTFAQVGLGQKLSKEIQPYSYWNMQFYQSEAAYVRFDYNIPRGASIGVYARRNALPTHTQYDLLEVLSGFKARTTRASHPSIKKEVTHYMEPGHWFLSLYNDDGDPQEVSFIAVIAEDMTHNCPNGCSGKGECLLGHCQCNPGFGGEDCSESVCPVLCSQRGEYINGECQCNPGWKGKECSLRHDECEVPDCNGHGHCTNGKCNCVRGYKGKFCEEVDCPHPTCSGHGFCAEGTCICKKGWKGADCSQMDKEALQCLPDCSGHGNFDLETQTCLCEPMWSGDDCSKELCDLDCGPHGHCVDNACDCLPGWSGELCNLKQCDPRCNEHGQCKNGTCLCVTGWNGIHCTMEACPNACSSHGQCRVSFYGQWECRCYEGWDGKDCSVPLEQNCNDGRDNDKDGLIDCADPECCSNHICRSSQLCVSAPQPIDILLRKQPPAVTASFFERMKFLIDEGSLQNYARQETFNESRSAVIRGRVVTHLGTGLMGVRVSTSTPLEGFTLTRDDGWFDLLVNGGGAVTLQFGRSPFKPQSHIVFVPWNEVVIIDKIVMSTAEEKAPVHVPHACAAHDYDLMKPLVLATWKQGFQGACPDKSAILAEYQAIQESLQIPGTGLNLVYHSSRVGGYLSTIQVQLTPETIPPTLSLVHLRISIEGILYERTFEADPVIKFTYAWNRLNVYRQRVYGVTTAMVKVGYEYNDCKDIIWDVQTTKLSGYDMAISDVGGWNLDIHHRYNFHEGILQKGDGSNIYLKHKPRVILTSMGDGHQRPLDCYDCDGQASKQRLLAPVALATAPDGSIFVGDFNLVRKILVDGTVRTIVRLNATRVSYRYHIAISPLDGSLYISDPESHQILRVRDTNDYTDPDHNWETVVGSGERCLPGDEAHCGDGALARDAKLAYPKGVAVSIDNVLYFADGTNIRMVDRDGIITTVIGNHMHKAQWKPIPCEGTLNVEEVHLRWPTELAINPLDNSLHMVDDHMVLQLAPDGRVKVVAGRPLHCASPLSSFDTELATHATLVMPQSIAFGPSGNLYIAESDSQRINRVRVIGTDGKISPYAGAESKCNCLERGCDCFEADHYLASTAKFNTISSVAVSPDGVVHIGDQANYRIRSVMASIPDASDAREYEIYSPDTQEIYVFNRFGQHIATKNILTGETVYLFTYNVNSSNGKLSTVTDAAGNKVFLLRDYSNQVTSIENTKGQKCRLRMTRMWMLHEFSTPDNYNVTFNYHGPTGLLANKLDSTGRGYVYDYDEFGRLTSVVTPTGKMISLTFDLSLKGAIVKIGQNNRKPVSMLIKGSSVVTKVGEAEQRTTVLPDGSVGMVTPWAHTVSTDTMPYSILAEIEPLLGESYPVLAKQRTEIAGDLANRFEWRYFLRKVQGNKNRGNSKAVAQVGRKLRVNGEILLSLEYDRETNTVAVFMDDRVELLNITYDRTARPLKWGPRNGIFAGVELEYDRFSRLTSWTWGDISETYGFDRAGRLYEIKYSDGTSMIYAFKDMFSSLPLKVTTPRGSDYLLQYDEAGALQSLTTPRGHIHAFSLQTSLGFYKYQYYSPMNRHPYEILYNDDGQILAKVYPHQSGKVAYVYDHTGKLETTLAGLSSIHYTYQETTSLVRSIDINEPNFEMRIEYKYHAGIVKDEKIKFGSKSGMDNAHYRYQYDGNARISGIEVDINGKQLPQLRLKYNQNLGVLEGVGDLRIYRNVFNRSVMQDSSKQFFTVTDYDEHGRVKTVLMNIRSLDVFRMELEYDNRNRIKMRKLMIGKESMEKKEWSRMDKITYNADSHVLEVADTDNNWQYAYDENGNIVGVTEHSEKIVLGYDSGDRVVQYGDVEFNSYDGRGFVVIRGEHKYRYNSRGQLIHASEHKKFQIWYFYDDRGRLVSWNDDRENITQFFYANPKTPDLITHVHFPKSSKTFRFLYDQRDFLMTVETSEQRFYVATDQNGSPLALFDTNGNLIKEMRRTPFGKIIKDTNPDFYLPIDFHGGLFDPNTKLIYLNKRLYDPTVGQWMTPAWEQMANELTTPTDIFIYRFRNNDPINFKQNVEYMTDLASWLKLYGYDISSMLGSEYTKQMVYQPSATITSPQLTPDFGVMSGLQCIVNRVHEKFSDLGFVPKPLLKLEPKTRNLLPRVAHRRAVFGEGILVSRVGGRALVSVVDGVNTVVQDVVTSVFNNSYFLPLHFSVHDQDVFYFVKDNALKIRDDMEELQRLGGMFNVSTHETTEHGAGTWKELRLHNPDAAVVIKYGADPEQERHRILKHAHKRAVERAWEIEKQLVMAGFQGRGDWSKEEKDELLNRGTVDGYEGVDIHSVHRYPQLADDPGNVAFTRDTKRKRRKSGNRRSRSHRHDS